MKDLRVIASREWRKHHPHSLLTHWHAVSSQIHWEDVVTCLPIHHFSCFSRCVWPWYSWMQWVAIQMQRRDKEKQQRSWLRWRERVQKKILQRCGQSPPPQALSLPLAQLLDPPSHFSSTISASSHSLPTVMFSATSHHSSTCLNKAESTVPSFARQVSFPYDGMEKFICSLTQPVGFTSETYTECWSEKK